VTKPLRHRRREPAPGVLRLQLPLPFPGLDRVNCYLLEDPDGCTLVDCGLYQLDEDGEHGWRDVEAALAAAGHSPGDVTRLFVTHAHIDHYGMAGEFVSRTGAELVMHSSTADDLDPYRDPAAMTQRLKELYADHGVTPEQVEELTQWEDWRAFVSGVVEPDVSVKDGDTIEIGERSWRCVYTPGHSRSHVCLWSETDRVLVSGDHLLGAITPHIDFRRGGEDDPLGAFLESLEKVEELAPALVLPGHGHPFEDGAERARVVMRHHDRRLGAILQVIRHEPRTADEITEAIFGSELLNFARRLALGEALAHLVYLLRRGEVERIERDGTYLFRKARRRRPSDEEDD
jgi:glyoxylase-like metal-dependent hydrolase (beta-lactamase superfamily II)